MATTRKKNKAEKLIDSLETEEQKKNRETVEAIASNIAALAKGVKALLNGPVNRRALVILLARSAQQTEKNVGEVLSALESLESDWLNKK